MSSRQPSPYSLAQEYLTSRQLRQGSILLIKFWKGFIYKYCNGVYIEVPKRDFESDLIRFLQENNETQHRVTQSLVHSVTLNLLGIANIEGHLKPPFWLSKKDNSSSDLINLKNGLFCIKSHFQGAQPTTPHTPDLFSVAQLTYGYDPDATSDTWQSFLNNILPDPNDQQVLQEWFGLNLVYDTSFQKFMVFLGEGANGKSVVCLVLRLLIGIENVSSINLDGFNTSRTFPLSTTIGKLANICSETSLSEKFSEGELKKFVGGDIMSSEKKHKDPENFKPTARLTFATNDLPKFFDRSLGIERRIIILPFEVKIEKPDPVFLSEAFWKNELPGIFCWALTGIIRLKERKKFTDSLGTTKGKEIMLSESNPSRIFLNECYQETTNPKAYVSVPKLYQKYRDQLTSDGFKPLSKTEFKKEVERAFPHAHATANPVTLNGERVRCWIGLEAK